MRIRAKVTVTSKKQNHWDGGRQEEVSFMPVHATEIEEDQRFSEATPSGSISLVMKKSAADRFELGKSYYVDFTPAEA